MYKLIFSALFLLSTTLFSQSWVKLGNALDGRHHPISFALNGKGYAVTGTDYYNVPTDDFYRYNPDTDKWTSLTKFPGVARSFGIGTVTNGKAYIGFGETDTQYLGDFWSYDDTDSSWTQLANCGCSARIHPALISIGNKIYVGLGADATGDLNDWWMYDISKNTWVQIDDLPGPARHHPYMFKAGGEVFAGLGHSGFNRYRDWYKLDTATNKWTTMNQFPGEGRVAGTQFDAYGFGFVLSGDGDDHKYMNEGEMWRYNPNNDTWKQLTSHPGKSRWAPGSFVIDNDVYFFGGFNKFTGIFPTDVWKFDISDTTTGISEEKLVLANTFAYPNPANNLLQWENDQVITHVKIYNTLGKLITRSNAKAKQMITGDFESGLYLIQFYADNELVKTSKLLIQH